MNENVILKSKKVSSKIILFYSFAIASIVCIVYSISNLYNAYNSYDISQGYRTFGFAAASMKSATGSILILPVITTLLFAFSRFLTIYSLTVTDKRVFGEKKIFFWKKSITLPIDSITSCSTINIFGIVSIGTPSGHIRFPFIVNANDIYNSVNELLLERCKDK